MAESADPLPRSCAERRLLEIRDRHCQHPGCRVPAERCEGDHVIERCDDGETTRDNGGLFCGTHNRQRPGRRKTPPPDPDDDIDDPDDTFEHHDDEDTEDSDEPDAT